MLMYFSLTIVLISLQKNQLEDDLKKEREKLEKEIAVREVICS